MRDADEIRAQNARDHAEAIQAPPPEIADDPEAFLEWVRSKPAVEPRAPRLDRPYVDRKTGRAPAKRVTTPMVERDPAYAAASAQLQKLPDFGAASLEAARLEPGMGDASWEALVIHAAAHPVTPPAGTDRDTPERPGTDAPACGCGTLLDPDGACLTCTPPTSQEAS